MSSIKEYFMSAIPAKSKRAMFIRNAGHRAIQTSVQRGATLLEAIAFLGIAAIVVLGAVGMLSSAFSSADVDKANNELVGMRVAIKKLYSNSNGYPAAGANMLPAIIAARALPGTLTVAANGAVTNGWGGVVTVTGLVNSFTITYNNVPQDACIGLLTASGQNLWLSITPTTGGALAAFPVAPAVALAACTSAGANVIAFQAR
jgi:hypothetical protein